MNTVQKLFLRRSIGYLADNVQGVATAAIAGEFRALDALERMLAGTVLFASQDEATGALVVGRSRPDRSLAADPQHTSPVVPASAPPRRKSPGIIKRLAVWLAIVGGPVAEAQVAGGPAGEPAATIEGRVFDQARGNSLNKARLVIEGTGLETFTDELGFYRFTRVSPGSVRLKVFYSGLGGQTVTVNAVGGKTVEQDFSLTSESSDDRSVIKLNAFVVASTQETNQAQIAINEQRFAPNFTSVVSTDEFGITSEGNVGEFVKFLPGVQTGGGQDARDISLGGVGPAYTPISMGGINLASAASSNASRTIELEQVSMTNLSRIEINKSPTPDQRADAIGGSVNLIPKSAFERRTPQYSYRLFFTGNDSELQSPFSFEKVPGRARREPGRTTIFSFELGAIVPINKRLGLTLSAADSDRATALTQSTMSRAGSVAIPSGSAATTPDRPYAFTSQLIDGGAFVRQRTVAAGVDFKLGRYDTFKADLSYTDSTITFANNTLTYTTAGVASFTANSSVGRTNLGNVTQTGAGRSKDGTTYMPSLRWMHRGPVWTLDSALGFSKATNVFEDVKKGFLQAVSADIRNVTITMEGVGPVSAAKYKVSRTDTATGVVTDINQYDISNYTIRNTATAPINSSDLVSSANLNAKRAFNFKVPLSLKVGADYRRLQREIHYGRASIPGLTYVGADKVAGSVDDVATRYLDVPLAGKPFVLGQPSYPWVSRFLVSDLLQSNPDYFTRNLAAYHQNLVTTEKSLDEAVASGYARFDARFLSNRLNVTAGARWERTNVSGAGNLIDPTLRYEQDAKGKVILDAAGRGIVRPEFTTGSAAENALAIARATYIERGATSKKSYADYYPSVNLAYNITANLVARASYASTLGRPNLSSIIPGIVIPEPSVTGGQETITFTNADLKPWTADNYALGLEYYFDNPSSGTVSMRGFRRDITNFFITRTQDITPEFRATYGLDEENYGNALLRDMQNSDVENRLFGLELAYSQGLGFLPKAIGSVRLFGNATLQRTTPAANTFSNGLPKAIYNWGIRHQFRKLTYSFNWNYRSGIKQGLLGATAANLVGPESYNYEEPRLTLDATIEYALTRYVGLFIGAKNVTNEARTIGRYSDVTPAPSRTYLEEKFGASYFFGIKGTF